MGTLVCNGRTLYRRDGFLVRSPIYRSITLQPDEIAYYMIAGAYQNGWPQHGFLNAPTSYGATTCEEQVASAFLNRTNTSQIWRQASTTATNLPNNLWYGGSFSCWGPVPHQSECFEMFAAYHFTIPPEYKDATIGSIKWTTISKGQIVCFMNALDKSTNNFHAVDYASKGSDWAWMRNSGWDTPLWSHKVGAFSTLDNNIVNHYNQAQDTMDIDVGTSSGTAREWEAIWTNSSGGGAIPICSSPYERTYDLSQNFTNFMQSNKSMWIIATPFHDKDEPRPGFYATNNNFYWLSVAWRTKNITVNLKVFD